MASPVKKPNAEERPLPFWKRGIPRYKEHTSWKRDEDGLPIFHDDGKCVTCKGEAKVFSHPWFQFKYQILGYCEACTTKVMGEAPSKEQEEKANRGKVRQSGWTQVVIAPTTLPSDRQAVLELEMLVRSQTMQLVLAPDTSLEEMDQP